MRWLLAAAAVFTSPSLQAQEPKGDLAKIQGRWEAQLGPEKNVPLVWTIKGDLLTGLAKTRKGDDPTGGLATTTSTLKLDEGSSPREIGMTKITVDFGGDVGALEYPDEVSIYEIDGDTLKVCSAAVGKPKPKAFKSTEDQTLITFRRVKDKPNLK